MTPETAFSRQFLEVASGHKTRIENSITSGMPDAHICLNGVDLWIEFKVVKGGSPVIRPSQYAWHARRRSNGGKSFIIAVDVSTERDHDVMRVWSYPFAVETCGKLLRITDEHACSYPYNRGGITELLNWMAEEVIAQNKSVYTR